MFRKILSVVLCVFMVASSVIPQKNQMVYAYNPDVPETQPASSVDPIETYPTTTDADFDISQVALLDEVDSLRTESTKTFQRADGSFVLAMYGDVIHYQKDGKWTDIDNTLTYDQLSDSYENKNNGFKVKFPNSIDANKKIKLTMGDYSINWSISSISRSSIQFSNPEMKSNNIKDLSGISQEVMYENVMKGVDVQYIITGSKVKENIILQSYIENFSLSFDYETKNLQLLSVDNEFLFVNENGEIVFNLTDLYAIDADGVETDNVTIRVDEIAQGKYKVIVSVDDMWLRDATYPVTIDPSIQLPNEGFIRDTTLSQVLPGSMNASPLIYCGYDSSFLEETLGYINFTVPTYLKNFDVTYATLNLSRYAGGSTLYLHELSTYYGDFSSLTWNTRPTPGQEIIDYAYFNSSVPNYKLDITLSVEKWNRLGLTSMPGFELSTNGALNRLYSIDSSVSSPSIEIGYFDSNGIKDYWTYNSQSVSYAGTGFVSDYTQELYFVRNDISFQTDLQTLGVNFVFNNNMAISTIPNIGYGIGWNISYNMKIFSNSPNSSYYSIDYTGNRVDYFPISCDSRTPSNATTYTSYACYLADDGSGSRYIRKYIYSYFVDMFILTPDNTKYNFDITYYDLKSISSLNNTLTISIVRESSNRQKIDYITDYRGNKIDFSYGANGNLESSTLMTKDDSGTLHNLEKVYYGYYGATNYLHDVYFMTDYNQDGDLILNLGDLRNTDRIVRYDNYASSLLATAFVKYVDSQGSQTIAEEIHYHYYSSTDPQVSYFESYYNSIKYSEVQYDLVENQTMVTDFAGNFVLYSFDNYGHTVNMLDSQGSVVSYRYHDIFTDTQSYVNGYPNYYANHRKTSQSVPQQMTFNPVNNYGFEDSSLNGWSVYSGFGTTITSSTSQNSTGTRSLRINNPYSTEEGYAQQSISLSKGVYFIKIDVLNLGTNGGTVSVQVGSQVQTISQSSAWQTATFSVSATTDQTLLLIKLYSHNLGQVYFDNVQVSSGANSQWVNLIDNPSFEHGMTDVWTPTFGSNVNEYSINDQSGTLNDLYKDVLGDSAIGLNGKVFTILERNYFDEVLANGGKIYVGGWALNYTAPSINNANLNNGKSVGIYVKQFDGFLGLLSSQIFVPFNLSYDNWQYSFGEMSLDSNCVSVEIGFINEGEGEVLFDGLSVFFDANTTDYEYDSKGRITLATFENGTSYTYSYALSTDIIPNQILDDQGHSITIESTNNQVTNIIKNNVKNSPVYNSYGQMTGYNITSLDGPESYFSTSTSYGHFDQYLSASNDEYGNTTTYYTDVISGLLSHIENAKGVSTNYEYYDDGILKKVYINNSFTNKTSYVEYILDEQDRLIEINLGNNNGYKIFYDAFNRIEFVQVNNQTLMSYTYWQNTFETGMISSQTYANGDTIFFEYDSESYNVTSVLFRASGALNAVPRFQYEYDALGRMSVYRDLVRLTQEEYIYDIHGNIVEIAYSNGDHVTYGYDAKNQPSSITFNISNSTWSTYFDFDESVANPGQYDQTSFDYNTDTHPNTLFYKDYIYQNNGVDDPLGRLLRVNHHLSINGINYAYDTKIGYQNDLTRIDRLTFEFVNNSIRNFEYAYTYDVLGNILTETYKTYDTLTSQYLDKITKKYMYDDLNQLIQESVFQSGVDCTIVANINKCYVKTYKYDTHGNITSQKTFKYLNTTSMLVEGPIPQAYETNYGNSSMFLYYNGTNRYYNTYSIPVGGSLSLSLNYYDMNTLPLLKISKVFTSFNYSGVDVNTPGFYLLEANAHDITYNYELEFGIVVKVGNVVAGELVDKKTYVYDATWKDQLDSITVLKSGVSTTSNITYDAQGNPIEITNFFYNGLKRHHATLSWEGRQLTNIKIYSGATTKIAEIWYSYNDQGFRISKILDTDSNGSQDKKYQYVWSGDVVVSEIVSNYSGSSWVEQYQMDYIFDYDGSLIGFKYSDGSSSNTYFYVLNLHGDVVKIISYTGYVAVEYSYDSYGNILSITGASASTFGAYNSYRYRSYKYDSDIGMYYLNSRYYNPETSRFINADGLLGQLGNLQSTNMYAYCANNPVMYTDSDGFMPNWGKMLVGASVIIGLGILTALTGGVAGVIFGAGFYGALSGAIGGAIFSGVFGAITGGVDGMIEGMATGFMWGAVIGGASGMLLAGINIASGGVKIIGSAQKTGNIFHRFCSNIHAGKFAMQIGRYSTISLDRSLNRAGLVGRKMPDVVAVARFGSNKLIEVVSSSQSVLSQANKIALMLQSNPGTTGQVVSWIFQHWFYL